MRGDNKILISSRPATAFIKSAGIQTKMKEGRNE
jgi:hypothetical protein